MTETINFYMVFESIYWDKPPAAEISLNGKTLFNGLINQQQFVVEFDETLEFDQSYTLSIRRYGKDDNQCRILEDGSLQDQILILRQLKIDRTDVKNLIDSISYNCPEYPEPWATEQRVAGVELEEKVLAETWFGHNGIWSLTFTAPFYRFLFKSLQ